MRSMSNISWQVPFPCLSFFGSNFTFDLNQRTNADERDLRSTAEYRGMRLMTRDFAFVTEIFAFECPKRTHRNSLAAAETLAD